MNVFFQGVRKVLAGFLALIMLIQPLSAFGYSYFDGQNFVNVSTPEFSGDPGYASNATGAFSYTVDLDIPAGRSGMIPNIGLSYSSQNKDEHNIFGYGWSGVTQYIERKNLTGTNRLYTDNYFTSSMAGDLELISTSTNSIYVPQNQGTNFVDYEFDGTSWVVTDKQGNTFTYGTGAGARLADMTDVSRVSRWYLEKQEDRNGNYIEYTYQKVSGQVYPNTIHYTGNGADQGVYRVEFQLRARPEITGYAPAFKVTTDQIIDQIDVYHETTKIQQYDLTHTQSVDSGREMLEKIEKTIYQPTIQTIILGEFDYSESNWSLVEDTTMTQRDENFSIYNTAQRHNGAGITLDLDGNGRTELARIDGSQYTASFDYSPLTNSWTKEQGSLPYSQMQPYIKGYTSPADMRGQSRVHKLFPHNYACGNSYNVIECSDEIGGSDGDGFNADFNGDGRTDVVWNDYYNSQYRSEFLTFNSDNPDSNFFESSVRDYINQTLIFNNETLTTDWNSDGLVDLVFRDPTSSNPYIYINDGEFDFTSTKIDLNNTTWSPYGNQGVESYKFIDINGDGISDMGQSYVSNPNSSYSYTSKIAVRKTSESQASVTTTLPLAFARWYSGSIDPYGVWFMDINHDGMLDAVMNRSSHTGSEKYFMNQGQIPDLMSSVTTTEGATMTPDYKRTTQLVDESGDLQNPDLYTPLMVVDSVAIDNGLGDVQQIEYDYYNGVFTYESLEKKKLAGFEKIEKTHVGKEQVITTYYHQGNENNVEYKEHGDSFEKIGKQYRVSTSDTDGNVVHDIFNTWTTGNRDDGSNYVYLSQTISRDYTIGKTEYIDKAQSYEYNNIHGGITKHTEWGEVNYSKNQDKVTDIKNDKRYTVTQYALGGGTYLPSNKQVFNSQDILVSHGRHYYDNQALGLITTGNVTTESHWLDTDNSWIDTNYTYNSVGLPLTITDARGNVTTTTYDSDNTYASSVVNDLNQTVLYEYDFVSGQVSKSTDPNGIVSENIFDGFGRVIEKKQSTPSGDMITVEINSFDDVSMPRSKTTQQYFTSTPKYSHTYVDGLERTLQSKQSTSNGDYQTNSYVYGATGILTLETQPYVSSNTNYDASIPSGVLSTVYEYDERDRIVEQSKPSGSEVYKYHQWGKTTIDPNGYHKKEAYDAFGNLIEVQEDIDTVLSSAPVSNATTTPYEFKKRITIEGKEGAGNDYQVLLKVGKDSSATSSDFNLGDYAYHFPQTRNDGGDLVFYNNAEDEMLPFWVEKVENDVAHVWVKVADSLEENADIFVYYGHDTPTNYSDGESTFIFFDEFETSVVDTTKWKNNDNGGILKITDGKLYMHNPNSGAAFQTMPTFGPETAIRWEGTIQEARYTDTYTGYSTSMVFRSDDNDNPQAKSTAGEFEPNYVMENHVFEIARRASDVQEYSVDDQVKNVGSSNKIDSFPFMAIIHKSNETYGGNTDIDWITVKKSTQDDPQFLTAGAEEGLVQVSKTYARLANASTTDIDLGTPEELEESLVEISSELESQEFVVLTENTEEVTKVGETIEDVVITSTTTDQTVITTSTTKEIQEPVEGNLLVTGQEVKDEISTTTDIILLEVLDNIATSTENTGTTSTTTTISTSTDNVEILVSVSTTTENTAVELSTTSETVVNEEEQEVRESRVYNGIPSTKPAKSYRFKELNYPLMDKISKTEAQVLNLENKILKKNQTLVNIDERIGKVQKRISDLEATKQKRESKGRNVSSQVAKIEKLENTIEKITGKKEKVQDRVSVLEENKNKALVRVVKQKERQEKQRIKTEKKKQKSLLNSAKESVQEFFSIPTADASTWANSLYDYKKSITVGGESELTTDQLVLLKIGRDDSVSGVDFHLDGLAEHFPLHSDDGGDLIFYNNDESQEMSFWVEQVENNVAHVWVKVTDDLSQDQTVNVYYGNTTPIDYSDVTGMFEFIEDFDAPLDPTKWEGITNANIVNGRLVFTDGVYSRLYSGSSYRYGKGYSVVFKGSLTGHQGSNSQVHHLGLQGATNMIINSQSNLPVQEEHVYAVNWNSDGGYTHTVDGEVIKSGSSNTGIQRIWFDKYHTTDTSDMSFDWIQVRKIYETEPEINFVEQVSYRVPQGSVGGITPTSVVGVTQYEYDALDQLVKIIDAEDNEREFEYDSLGRQISSELPHTSTSTAAAHVYTYDVVGNKTSETRPDGSVIGYTYDDLNRVLTVDNPSEGMSAEVIYSYDTATNGLGKLAGISGDGYTKTYQYDSAGNLTTESVNVGGTIHTTTMSYSDYGLLESTTNPDGSTVSNSYYVTGDISGVDRDSSDVVDINYNHMGQIVSQDYANGIDQTYTYNPVWDYRLQNKETTNATGTVLEDLNYYYDRTGNISAITDSGSEQLSFKTYDYDSVDRLINAGYTASTTVTDINQLGSDIATAMSDYEQDLIDRANDLLERETITISNLATSSVVLNPTLGKFGYQYYNNSFNDINSLNTRVERYQNSYNYRTRYEFNQSISQDTTATRAQLVINNMSLPWGGGFYVQLFEYGNSGLYSYGQAVSNQVVTVTGQNQLVFDVDLDWITDQMQNGGDIKFVIRTQGDIDSYWPSGGREGAFFYGNNTTLEIDTEEGSSITKEVWKHRPKDLPVPTYPDIAQIIADHASSTSVVLDTDTYTYSETGNILTHNSDVYTYTNGTFPQAATVFAGNTYTYDDNGNLSSKDNGSEVSTYTYDWNDRLSSVDQGSTNLGTYTYTDARQRLSKSVGTSTKYYINNNVEYDGDYTNHVFAGANRVLTSDVDGLHYTHKDHLQSTSLTTDSSGIVEEAVDYKAFGSERSRSGAHESNYTYTDQEKDETGLMYYDARYYDADLKRFTSVDPLLIRFSTEVKDKRLTNPQDLNGLYTYVLNNPLKYTDPTGEQVQFESWGAMQYGTGGGRLAEATYNSFNSFYTTYVVGTYTSLTSAAAAPRCPSCTMNAIYNSGQTYSEYLNGADYTAQQMIDIHNASLLSPAVGTRNPFVSATASGWESAFIQDAKGQSIDYGVVAADALGSGVATKYSKDNIYKEFTVGKLVSEIGKALKETFTTEE